MASHDRYNNMNIISWHDTNMSKNRTIDLQKVKSVYKNDVGRIVVQLVDCDNLYKLAYYQDCVLY